MTYTNTTAAVGRGAGLIAACVTRAGHELAWFDTYYTPAPETAARIVDGNFDVLLVSAMTMNFSNALRIIRDIKARTDIPVLLGGLHVTIHGARLLQEHSEIDYACVGEGESFVAEFLERLGTPELTEIENLVWHDGNEVRANPVRPAEDLATLPEFPWHLFPPQSIVHGKDGFLYVNASRGCPFNCTYCCNGIMLRQYGKDYLRFRPVGQVLDEIAFLRRHYTPRAFYFEDEMLFFNKELATGLFEGLHRLKALSGAMARVETLDQDMVDMLAANGLRFMAIGVECGDEAFRREYLNRHMDNTQITNSIAMLKAAGIYTKTLNMIGYPVSHDAELTKTTVEFTERVAPDAAQFTIFYPFPGTKLHDYCVENDLIDPEKSKAARNYYEDSVLRGVTLADTRKRLDERFNPLSQQLKLRVRFFNGSLRSCCEISRAWLGLRRRELKAVMTGKGEMRT